MSKDEREEIIVALSMRKNYSMEFLDSQPDHVLEQLMRETEAVGRE